MRIVRFIDEKGQIRYGRNYDNDDAVLLEGDLFTGLEDTGESCRVKKLLAPLLPPAVFGIGLNYRKHAEETGMQTPQYPVLFMKNPAAVTNPGDPILLHASCMEPPEVDYEAELAVVIGKAAKDVAVDDAFNYVLGYTAANDVSARRWQGKRGAGQWVRGKSFDTFCPLGPQLVTSDELDDPQNLRLTCVLNGQVMQDANTSDMIFPVTELIAFLSSGVTLLPGSVILTGTPSGVGFTRKPPVYLMPGDTVDVSVEGIGTLSNSVELQK
ncbi:MAG: fumarylacetoacetate hydrolase family protein [Deltaproteobacteria bacterium]|nr:fumarylacetoacetate hydrolase family protein [Deltaproteobacteria bacterium]